MFKKLTLN
jgi:hypothetical protein